MKELKSLACGCAALALVATHQAPAAACDPAFEAIDLRLESITRDGIVDASPPPATAQLVAALFPGGRGAVFRMTSSGTEEQAEIYAAE
jgi:hypothetical protein